MDNLKVLIEQEWARNKAREEAGRPLWSNRETESVFEQILAGVLWPKSALPGICKGWLDVYGTEAVDRWAADLKRDFREVMLHVNWHEIVERIFSWYIWYRMNGRLRGHSNSQCDLPAATQDGPGPAR